MGVDWQIAMRPGKRRPLDKDKDNVVDGLIDKFISVGGSIAGVNLLGMYHYYDADNQGYAYGQELNLLVSWKANKHLTLLTKYANYQGDKNTTNIARNGGAPSIDLSKAWLQADVQF